MSGQPIWRRAIRQWTSYRFHPSVLGWAIIIIALAAAANYALHAPCDVSVLSHMAEQYSPAQIDYYPLKVYITTNDGQAIQPATDCAWLARNDHRWIAQQYSKIIFTETLP